MYVPGKGKECEKIRDELNAVFIPPAWNCTPVCKNKYNTKGRCGQKDRVNRRIRRRDDNTDKSRYILKYHSDKDDDDDMHAFLSNFYGSEMSAKESDHVDDDAYEIKSYSLVGDGWKGGLRNKEDDDDQNDDAESWKNWRKRTRVVGLDFTDCECQSEGDYHLTCVRSRASCLPASFTLMHCLLPFVCSL